MHLKAKKRNKATNSQSIQDLPTPTPSQQDHIEGLKTVSTKYKPRCLADECL